MSEPERHEWSVRVSASGRGEAAVYARGHRFDVGPALSFDRDEPKVTALEHVLGALGADVATGLLRIARKRRVEIHSVEATVEASLSNPLTWLRVVGEEGDPSLSRVKIRVYVSTPADPVEVEPVWREAIETSPLVSTFRRSVELELTYKAVI